MNNPNCVFCGGQSYIKQKINEKQQYKCKECGRHFMESEKISANILLFDIETTPIEARVWGAWNQNISIKQIQRDWHLLSWSAKWLNAPEILGDVLTPSEIKKASDKRITASLHRLFDIADIIIAHNGNQFDFRRMNQRFLFNNLMPPAPYQKIDTKIIAKKVFGFTHNKLDYIARKLDLPVKMDTEFDLWNKCMAGDQQALDYMLEYNKKDVLILEEVYHRLKGWGKSLIPNINIYDSVRQCSVAGCGCTDLKYVGEYYTNLTKYKSYQCQSCGGFTRETKSKKLTNVAR